MAKVDPPQAKQSERRVGVYDRPDKVSLTTNKNAIIIGIIIAAIIVVLLWLWLT